MSSTIRHRSKNRLRCEFFSIDVYPRNTVRHDLKRAITLMTEIRTPQPPLMV
jgi:hypothetical protein